MRCTSLISPQYLTLLLELKTLPSSVRHHIVQDLVSNSEGSQATTSEDRWEDQESYSSQVRTDVEDSLDDVGKWICGLEDEFEPIPRAEEDVDDVEFTSTKTMTTKPSISIELETSVPGKLSLDSSYVLEMRVFDEETDSIGISQVLPSQNALPKPPMILEESLSTSECGLKQYSANAFIPSADELTWNRAAQSEEKPEPNPNEISRETISKMTKFFEGDDGWEDVDSVSQYFAVHDGISFPKFC